MDRIKVLCSMGTDQNEIDRVVQEWLDKHPYVEIKQVIPIYNYGGFYLTIVYRDLNDTYRK